MRLVLASRNENKLRELRAVLPDWEIALLDAPDEPVEDGDTFLDNARIKARHGRPYAAPEDWVAGEDAGIEVAALGGAPGIHSARWAEDGVTRLLAELDGVEDRRARYVSELVALAAGGAEVSARGTLDGEIARERRGTRGVRLRPDLRAAGRVADGGRARGRVEGGALAPGARRAATCGCAR